MPGSRLANGSKPFGSGSSRRRREFSAAFLLTKRALGLAVWQVAQSGVIPKTCAACVQSPALSFPKRGIGTPIQTPGVRIVNRPQPSQTLTLSG